MKVGCRTSGLPDGCGRGQSRHSPLRGTEAAGRTRQRDVCPVRSPPRLALLIAEPWRSCPASAPANPRHLPVCERVGLGAGFEERDLQRPFVDPVAAGARAGTGGRRRSTPLPSSSTSTPWAVPGASPSRRTRNGIGAAAPPASTRWASRAWNRKLIVPPACSSTTASLAIVHSPDKRPAVQRRSARERRRRGGRRRRHARRG